MDKPVKKKFYKQWWFWTIMVVVLITLISAGGGSSGGTSQTTPVVAQDQGECAIPLKALKSEVTPVSYKELEKDPTSYTGKVATFTGQVLEIQQNGNDGVMRLSVTNEGYGIWSPNDVLYITYHQPTPVVVDDIVTVTGSLTGSQTYTSQANYQITLPSMDTCGNDIERTSAKTTTTSAAVSKSTVSVQTKASVPAPVVSSATWHTVQTFSGQTQKNTSTFKIQGSQWRITWQDTGDGYFGANTESPDGSNYCSIANAVGSGSDTTYCYQPGTYYISVNTSNSWTMTVEDYY